ncbi:MAG: hypothetical protein WC972_02975 [Trueperaceae bacterium]
MSPFACGLVVGLVVGLLVAAKRGDEHLDPVSRRQAEMEQRVWDVINQPEYEEHA